MDLRDLVVRGESQAVQDQQDHRDPVERLGLLVSQGILPLEGSVVSQVCLDLQDLLGQMGSLALLEPVENRE